MGQIHSHCGHFVSDIEPSKEEHVDEVPNKSDVVRPAVTESNNTLNRELDEVAVKNVARVNIILLIILWTRDSLNNVPDGDALNTRL